MQWQDHPSNPVLGPRWWSWLVGDPSVLEPARSPDGRWHLFANNLTGIYQYVSTDGVGWRLLRRVDMEGNRPWIVRDEGRYYLHYQKFSRFWRRSRIVVRTSEDCARWSAPVDALAPDLPWEGSHTSNPCLLQRDGRWWLYYSANLVYLEDMGFSEPSHISVATGPGPLGPWRKHGSPILGPTPGHPFRERGAGALKVYDGLLPDGTLAGFENGIFRDGGGRSGSAILLLRSRDGLTWEEHPDNPILAPAGQGWRRAHVYQLDVKRVGGELWMWYNARDGWRFGVERIGLAILANADRLWPRSEA